MPLITASKKGRFGALFCFLLLAMPAVAQKSPTVGVTLAGSPPSRFADAFRRGLAERGWVHGRNITIQYHYAGGQTKRLPDLIDALVKSKVDVIVAGGGNDAHVAAQKATRSIPIVIPVNVDPVGAGLVSNLARPGANITGLSMVDTSAKRVEFLKESFPHVKRIAALFDPVSVRGQRVATEAAAKTAGLELEFVSARQAEDIEPAVTQAIKGGAEALLVLTSGFLNANAQVVVEAANRNRIIAMYDNRTYVDAGGLISYGTDLAELYRLSARYVDQILRGAKPGDLPIEQAAKFELVVNLRTARALGVTLPPVIALRADHVIQ